jgi:3-oxoacyl-[acyl-carrier protein] reductase
LLLSDHITKLEIRSTKYETIPKPETRIPNLCGQRFTIVSDFLLRISDLFRISDFGFRIFQQHGSGNMNAQRKVALITGSATGIGRAAAIRFAREGLAVAINYAKSAQEAEETLAVVQALGVPAIMCQANVADESAVREMVRRCADELGGIDVLVNNAGTTRFIDHTDFKLATAAVWDEIMNVNVKGAFFCCREAMPHLEERGGCIVNVTSVAGLQGHGSSIPYAASKAALNCMTKSLARAFGPKVRVNAVAPGPVLTRWLANHQARVAQSLQGTPMGRAAEPEDIADAIWYLAQGTTLVTGQVLVVDGGRTV